MTPGQAALREAAALERAAIHREARREWVNAGGPTALGDNVAPADPAVVEALVEELAAADYDAERRAAIQARVSRRLESVA